MARDVEIIADALDIEEFSVVGRSGGGPGAIAVAALIPDRVRSLAVLVGVAPNEAKDSEWDEGMTEDNRAKHAAARDPAKHDALIAEYKEWQHKLQRDPFALIDHLWPELPDADKALLGVKFPDSYRKNMTYFRRHVALAHQEGMKNGPYGWVDDVLALHNDWGFDPKDASAVPSLIWSGAEDRFSPPRVHAKRLGELITGSHVIVSPAAGHFSALEVYRDVFQWLKTPQSNPNILRPSLS